MVNTFAMSETEMVELSNKAVRGFINKKFSTFFSEDDIQDIVQDTLLSMWERRDTYDPERGTKFAWAWTIAKSKVLDAAASKARRDGRFTHFKDGELPIDCTPYMVSADEYAADGELLLNEFMDGMFDTLKSDRDKLLLAWMMDGVEPKEIAERLDIPLSAVYMARHHLRERLGKNAA